MSLCSLASPCSKPARLIIGLGVVIIALAPLAAVEKRLFLDTTAINSSRNLTTILGQAEKSPQNPLMQEEFPKYAWEPRFDNMYPSVVWDATASLYRCWYVPFVIWTKTDWKKLIPKKQRQTYREAALCYAESTDGIHWRKPLMPEFPFDGQPSNVLLRYTGEAGVLWDTREQDPARRYKLLFKPQRAGSPRKLSVAFSPDGLHWSEGTEMGLSIHADTHNNAIWAPTLGRYVAITRDWQTKTGMTDEEAKGDRINQVRCVARTESTDFIHWSPVRVVLRGLDDQHQIYSMPIFFYAGVYFGLATVFEKDLSDRSHVELTWSKDTIEWHRIEPGRPLIANGEPEGAYDWGCIFASVPVIESNRISLYYGGTDGLHGGPRKGSLSLATLRPDGFAGVAPADRGAKAEVSTTTLSVEGAEEVLLSADIDQGGSIQVIVLDPANGRELGRSKPLAGPAKLSSSPIPLTGDGLKRGKPVRLKFEFSGAVLYSYSI